MKRKQLLGPILVIVCGIIGFLGFLKVWDIKTIFTKDHDRHNQNPIIRHNINFFIWDGNRCRMIIQTIILPEDFVLQLQHAIQAWFNICQEKRIIQEAVLIESIFFSADQNELFIEIGHKFFSKNISVFEKVQIIETLCYTISGMRQNIKKLYFVYKDKLLEDEHLDFAQGWSLINRNKLSSFID